MDTQEKRNRRIGIITSLGIHFSFLIIFLFIIAWRAADPPLPEYGVELNFGLDDQGGGQIQPDAPAGSEGDKSTDLAAEESKPQTEDATANQEQTPEVQKEAEQSVSKVESPVVVKEEKKTSEKENKTVEPSQKEKVVAEYKKEVKTATDASKTEQKKGEPGNQGDDVNKAGDKGSPEGKLDAKALYGTPGGGGGGTDMNLQMAGWSWADQPQIPDIPGNENGKVIFEIECDANGDITRIITVINELNPRAEQILKEVIRNNSLVRSPGARAPEKSKGQIVFRLKTK